MSNNKRLMKEIEIYDILGKYLAGEINKKESEIVHNWIDESPLNAKEFEFHKKAWEETHINFNSSDSESVFRNVLNKIDEQQEQANGQATVTRKIKQQFIFITKVAASLLLFASIWYYFNTISLLTKSPEIAVKIIQKYNVSGQKSKIYLPDGSQVWLNAESEISFPEKFSVEKREVVLIGEAFFNVIENPDLPFIVKTGKISTTVLGTSFNVKAFENDPAIYVALKSGRVKVEIDYKAGKEEIFLKPGEAINYNKTDAIAVKKEFDQELLLAWKDGVIVFKDAQLNEIISVLSRWYGVQFEVINWKNDSWSYTGSFDNAYLENVLQSISFTKEFSYNINQKNVTIKFN